MQDEITTSLSAAIAAGDLPGRGLRPAPVVVDRPHRMGPLPQGTVPLLPADQGGFRDLDRPVQGSHRARSDACRSRAPISPPSWCRASSSDGSRARANCGRAPMSLAESSVRLDPRSSFAFQILAYLQAMEGHYEAAMDAAKRAVGLEPVRHGRPRRARYVPSRASANIARPIELFSMAAQRGNTDPRYQWAAVNAFSHYLLGNMTPRCHGRAKRCISIPIICRRSRCGRRRSPNWDEPRRRPTRPRSLLSNYPEPDRRTALAQFPLETSGRHRPLP